MNLQLLTSPAQQPAKHSQAGWTLIETLIVLAIILLLSGAVGFMALEALDKGRISAANNQVASLYNSVLQYAISMGNPPSKADGGLKALITRPQGASGKNWPGRFLDKDLPIDPWGRPYEYILPGDALLPEGYAFGIYSPGADGRQGGEGTNADITSW